VPAATAVTFAANEQVPLVAIVPPDRVTVVEPEAAVIVPLPQVPVRPFGVDTTKPAGSASVNATPASAIDALGFEMVKVSDVEPASPIEAAPNAFVMLGGVPTIRFAVAVFPVPPFVEVTGPVVLVETPGFAPVTFTLKVQDVPAAIVAPARLTAPAPAVAVIVPPAHDPERPLGVATVIPAGNVSVNATPANGAVFAAGFVMVKLRVELPFGEMAVGLNAFTMEGGVTTKMLAEAVPPAPPSAEVTFPVVLFCVPAAIPVTFTANVHEPLATRVAPVRLIATEPCVAVMEPAVHVPARPLGEETTRPAGSASVNPTPDRLCAALLF
jgi:hypothetical protein